MNRNTVTTIGHSESVLATNKVLRNTYMLLGLNFLFSALTAAFSLNAAPLNPLVALVLIYGLMFLTNYLRNSIWGLASIFAFTGVMGYTLGPILNLYIHGFANGPQLIATALGGTGLIFFGLSGYALTTRKDFSYLNGFVVIAMLVAVFAMIAGIFIQLPGLQLGIAAVFMLLSSAIILMQTSAIINGGETNYIMATITLFVSIYNLFISLLQILGAFSNNRD